MRKRGHMPQKNIKDTNKTPYSNKELFQSLFVNLLFQKF